MLVPLEPADLPARIAAGQRLRLSDRLSLGEPAAQLGERLRVADRPRGRHPLLDSGGAQPVDLAEQPGRPHPLDAGVEASDEQLARRRKADDERRMPQPRRLRQRCPVTEPGELVDLQRSHDATAVRRVDLRRGHRIYGFEPGVERTGPLVLELCFEPRAQFAIPRGEAEVVHNARDIEAGAADQDRDRVALLNGLDRSARVPLVGRDTGLVSHLENVEQVMRDAAPISLRHFRRADVHAAVQLHRIRVHDLGRLATLPQRLCHANREVRFAGARRADDREERGARHAQRRSSFGS